MIQNTNFIAGWKLHFAEQIQTMKIYKQNILIYFYHLISFLREGTSTQTKQVGATDTVEIIDKLKVDNVLQLVCVVYVMYSPFLTSRRLVIGSQRECRIFVHIRGARVVIHHSINLLTTRSQNSVVSLLFPTSDYVGSAVKATGLLFIVAVL